MTPNRVVLLTGNPLRSNPRVVKEAGALAEAGFDVRVLGAWSPERGVEADMRVAASGGYAFRPLLRSDSPFGALHLVLQRAARQCAPRSSLTFGLMPVILEREAIRLRPHLAIAHSEPALFAALALHKRGVKVGVDMEDWFSEDLPTDARRGRPVELLRKSERELLRCAAHATCTSEVMADALARAYGCARPTRIYNVFPKPVLPDQLVLRDRSPASKSLDGAASRGRAVRSIHWFSQTIGPGRGLEDLFAAAESLPEECEIHLRGNPGGYRRWIESAVPLALRSRVFVHAPVPNDELPERIAEHDIGFAGETTAIRSRDLTATNKIFQYLQSGLAVVASDTAGQREVASLAGVGVRLFRANDAEDLATKLVELTENAALLRENRESARLAAQQLCWEKEQQRFLDVVRRALPGSAE